MFCCSITCPREFSKLKQTFDSSLHETLCSTLALSLKLVHTAGIPSRPAPKDWYVISLGKTTNTKTHILVLVEDSTNQSY